VPARNLDKDDAVRALKIDLERAKILQASEEFSWFLGKVSGRRDATILKMADGLSEHDYRVGCGVAKGLQWAGDLLKHEVIHLKAELGRHGVIV
jgi:hypothetical protein